MSVSLSDIDRVYLNNKARATIVKSISNPPLMLWATFVPFLNFWHRNHSDSYHSNQNVSFRKLIQIIYVMCDMCTKFEIIS